MKYFVCFLMVIINYAKRKIKKIHAAMPQKYNLQFEVNLEFKILLTVKLNNNK